ncbi:MAG: glycosyl hydrolase family 18 protein [Bacteroidales bacterium]|jgi:spore germination protein YaaH|nr:glycosyl hydrolase family 18 protein [Bacteroidales bacterium]
MTLPRITLILPIIIANGILCAQDIVPAAGIHQEESEYWSKEWTKDHYYDEKGAETPSSYIADPVKELQAKVLGWHPYWAASSAYQKYDYSVLSHIAYFSYEVDTATGGYSTIRGWESTPIIDYAHQRGTKVLLTVTNFGTSRNTALLSDTVKQKHLLETLIPLLKSRNADGVNFDLENVALSQKSNLVSFMQRAVSEINAEMPSAEISMATPAVDWSGSWDLKNLSEVCDYLIIMGYNYYWSGSSTAGPVAPLLNETYNVSRSVNTYLDAGVAPGKLMLGVPWYGYDWPVEDDSRKSKTTGTGTARTLAVAESIALIHSRTFDGLTKVPWVSYMLSSAWRQLWFDDSQSLLMKYDYSLSKALAGIGIWALSYEGTVAGAWSSLKEAFLSTIPVKSAITRIFPNPLSYYAQIEYDVASLSDITLKICDMNGRVMEVLEEGSREPGRYTVDLDASHYGQGVYICVLNSGKTSSSRKIVIIKQ